MQHYSLRHHIETQLKLVIFLSSNCKRWLDRRKKKKKSYILKFTYNNTMIFMVHPLCSHLFWPSSPGLSVVMSLPPRPLTFQPLKPHACALLLLCNQMGFTGFSLYDRRSFSLDIGTWKQPPQEWERIQYTEFSPQTVFLHFLFEENSLNQWLNLPAKTIMWLRNDN